MTTERISAPQHIASDHDLASFDCGVEDLNAWLMRRALPNDLAGASRTFVITAHGRVVGYYALAAGALAHSQSTGRVRHNMPDPVPVMVLARLAVDMDFQGRGLGWDLLRDAMLRTLGIAEQAGIRAVLLHAVSEDAKRFYVHHGFAESPVDPMVKMIALEDIEKALGA